MSDIRDLLIHLGVQADMTQLKKFDRGVSIIKTGMFQLVAATTALGYGLKKVFTAGAEQEMTEIAFTTMLGSAEKANDLIKQMEQFSLETPFKFEEAESTIKMMLAMGSTYEDVIEETRMLGDVSAGLNVPMSRLALNFGQVRSMGRLMGREIRDFAVAGVPILEILGEQLGKSKSEITDMASKGQISFEQTKKAFEIMTQEGGKFADLMGKSAKSAKGLASNIGVLADLALRRIGRELNDGVLKEILEKMYNWGKEGENVKNVLKSVLGMTLAIGASFALWGLVKLLGGIGMVATALFTMGNVALVAQAKLLLTPLLLIGAFAVLGAIIEDVWKTFQDPRNKTVLRELIDIIKYEFPAAFEVLEPVFGIFFNTLSRALDILSGTLQWLLGGLVRPLTAALAFLMPDSKMLQGLNEAVENWQGAGVDRLKKGINYDTMSHVFGETPANVQAPTQNMQSRQSFYNPMDVKIEVNGADGPEATAREISRQLKHLEWKGMSGGIY